MSNEPKSKIKDYLEDELQKICLLEANSSRNVISVDEALDIYSQIQSELIPISLTDINENQIEEYLKNLEEDEQSVREESSNVCCPVCQRSNLVERNSMITCSSHACTFKIDMQKSGLTLSRLHARLEHVMGQHACTELPCFQFKSAEMFNKSDLIMLGQFNAASSASFFLMISCEHCNFLDLIA